MFQEGAAGLHIEWHRIKICSLQSAGWTDGKCHASAAMSCTAQAQQLSDRTCLGLV